MFTTGACTTDSSSRPIYVLQTGSTAVHSSWSGLVARFVLAAALLVPASCAIPGTAPALDRAGGAPYDVEHYTVALDIDPVQRTVSGRCTIRLWALVDETSSIDLHFVGMNVAAVTDGAGRRLSFERRREVLRVKFAAPIVVGGYAEITVAYSGKPTRGLWFAGERDGVPTQVFTHGECEDARGWFPCRDQPDDRATSEICVTMPRNWTAIAAGERIERSEHDSRATERWRMGAPHPAYLATLVAGEFVVEHGEWEGTPLAFVAAPDRAEDLCTMFAETGNVLSFFSGLTGVRYPYGKYAQVCVDNFPYGGMENISATTLTDTILPDEDGLSEHPARELIAHEAAHQWFGNLVTCAEWSEIWLNEGFATYMSALYEEHAAGRDAFEQTMRSIRDVYLARDVGTNRRPIVSRADSRPLTLFFTGHVYQGGAIRLHYLRTLLGEEVFFAGIRRYLAEHRGTGVYTADVQRAFESVSRRDLGRFFEQWFHTAGHPRLKSVWSWNARRQCVVLTLDQTGERAFDFEMDVELAGTDGAQVHRVRLESARGVFELPASSEPQWVRVDPHDAVPMDLDERMRAEDWLALASRGDTAGRVRAVRMLGRARNGAWKPEDALALEDELVRLATTEANPYVRRALLTALSGGTAPSAATRELFVRSAQDSGDPRAQIAALKALQRLGPDDALRRLADEGVSAAAGLAVRAEWSALRARAIPEGAFEFLTAQLASRSRHGEYEARLLTELLATKDPRARAVLLAWMRDPTRPDAARAAAVRGVSRTRLQHDEIESVIDLLSSPRIRLRREAVAALGASKDPRARVALEEYLSTSPSEIERIAVDDLLAKSMGDS